MRVCRKLAIVVLFQALGVCLATGQQHSNKPASHKLLQSNDEPDRAHGGPTLTDDDRLSLIAAALDSKVRSAEPDCSHLVHAIYEQAGFTYEYAPSSDLYTGLESFQRVKKPEPGDVVAWRGHVGIVIKPSQHLFFSVLSSGPGVDDYTTPYWKRRGKPRFYRYIKSFVGPQQPSPKLMRTNRVRGQTIHSDEETDDH